MPAEAGQKINMENALNGAWLADHDSYPDDGEDAAANHVHHVLGLTRTAIHCVSDICTDGGSRAGY